MITIGSSTKDSLEAAWNMLSAWFDQFGRISVLVSGGVDSSVLLAAAASRSSARKVTAVTADSPSMARAELEAVRRFVAELGVPHLVLPTKELENPAYRANSGDRCYYCKKALYESVEAAVLRSGSMGEGGVVVDGTNADDLGDHRPSLPASREHGIRHPYVELSFGKKVIRELGRFRGLPMWNKPAMACLASRIQEGVSVAPDKLALVERAEAVLFGVGMKSVRVRYHESGFDTKLQRIARIEVPPEELPALVADSTRERISRELRKLGFTHVTLDLEGYKRGGRPT